MIKYTFETLCQLAPQRILQKLEENKQLKENPIHHPEENAYEHIKIVTNRLFEIQDIDLQISAFFHDICKWQSKVPKENSPYFLCKDHEKKAVDFCIKNANWILDLGGDLGKICWIIDNHMRIKLFDEMKKTKRKEMIENPWFNQLWIFSKADDMNLEWKLDNIELELQLFKQKYPEYKIQ